MSVKLPSCGRLHALLLLAPSASAPAVLCCSRSSGSFGLRGAVCRALADMKDKLRQTLGSAVITNSAGCLEEHFVWEIPIYKPQVEAGWSISCGNSLFTNSTCCLEERFVWEISIYKLNWSVSCGKFLFTNSTGAFRVGNFYLQTQLERFVWEISIYKLNWSVSCGKFLFTNSTSVFSLFTNYLQTYLQTSFLREKAIFRHGHIKIQSLIEGFLTTDRSPGKCFFPYE